MSRNPNIIAHPSSAKASEDRAHDRENLARQLRTTQMMREQAREQINPTDIITDIRSISLLMEGQTDQAGNLIPLDKEILASLRARADIKFKLLNKVLPDLKQTESTSHNTHDHLHAHGSVEQVSNMELAQRLQLWRKGHVTELDEAIVEVPSAPPRVINPEVAISQPDDEPTFDFLL